jgi:hypothetical protein
VAENLLGWNSRQRSCTRDILRMAGDYSSVRGYATYSVDRMLIKEPIIVSLAEQEQAAVPPMRSAAHVAS